MALDVSNFSLPNLNVNWGDLMAALALYLVLEGVLPFLAPDSARRAFARMGALGNMQLRVAGLVSMLLGLGLLYVTRHAL